MRLSRGDYESLTLALDDEGLIELTKGNHPEIWVGMTEADLRWLLYCAGPALLNELQKVRGAGTAEPGPAPQEPTEPPDGDQLALDEFAEANAAEVLP